LPETGGSRRRRRRGRGKFAGELEIEFLSTKLDGTSTKRKIRRGEAHPGAWDGEKRG
jgi:hypothetical protein